VNLQAPAFSVAGLPPDVAAVMAANWRQLERFTREALKLNRAAVLGDTVQLFTKEVTVPSGVYSDARPFSAFSTAAGQSLANNASTVVNYDTLIADTDAAVTTGAAWKCTVPAGKSGLYQVSATASVSSIAAGDVILELLKNGSEVHRFQRVPGTASIIGLTGTHVLKLVAGDFLQVAVFQNSGGARLLEATAVANHVAISCLALDQAAPLSCWPVDLAYTLPASPVEVRVIAVADTNATTPANTGPTSVDWTLVTVGARNLIRVRNVTGLPAGRTFNVTFAAWGA
jgi:hypothetical protein